MSNPTVKRENLEFKGVDEWYRLVWKHKEKNAHFCTVDRLWENGDDPAVVLSECSYLYVKSPASDFEGEPNSPVDLI